MRKKCKVQTYEKLELPDGANGPTYSGGDKDLIKP